LREVVQRVTASDFSASWRAGETAGRSHESSYYFGKYQLRLDEATSRQLEALTHTFDRPAAEVIRQLILQAKPKDFPQSWQMAVTERQHLSS
jgi:hypothetical protein